MQTPFLATILITGSFFIAGCGESGSQADLPYSFEASNAILQSSHSNSDRNYTSAVSAIHFIYKPHQPKGYPIIQDINLEQKVTTITSRIEISKIIEELQKFGGTFDDGSDSKARVLGGTLHIIIEFQSVRNLKPAYLIMYCDYAHITPIFYRDPGGYSHPNFLEWLSETHPRIFGPTRNKTSKRH